ncbi:hypothetical protein TEA_016760 [Camellia sinensis var. sinensis]|uniref:BHLH domain-containing protein n=1 Tax=Camellia sinensis var. sinensis TaxID=542762 RepID=A0A4S4ECQ7_CAMSN|nr:hypothetical protein TEA_016760 [Camellia sinensis var. sinensis]
MQPRGSGSSSKLDRNEIEKSRRLQLKDLYSKLASLIPNQPSEEGLPLRDMLKQATKYVVELKQNVEELKRRKAALKGDEGGSKEERSPVLMVRNMGSTLEVNLSTGLDKEFKLHEVLSVLKEEGVEVVSASYTTVGNQIFYTIHAQAARVTLGGVEAVGIDCVVTGTGIEVVGAVEEVTTPAPLGLAWGTSNTINKSWEGMAKYTSILVTHQFWYLFNRALEGPESCQGQPDHIILVSPWASSDGGGSFSSFPSQDHLRKGDNGLLDVDIKLEAQ